MRYLPASLLPVRGLVLLIALSPACSAVRIAGAEADRPRVIRLGLQAAPEPRPVLRYQLLPPATQRQAGNAAPYYYRALLLQAHHESELVKPYVENREQWLNAPLDELPKDEIRAWLRDYRSTWIELQRAAFRDRCDWGLRIGDLEGMERVSFSTFEFQWARQLARMLRVKSRLEIAEGKFDDALHSLQIGYRLGIDVAKPPTVINALVGVAICDTMNDGVIELIGAPGSPNLYWALAKLPRPLIEMRPALEYEKETVLRLFPFLNDVEATRTQEQWLQLAGDMARKLGEIHGPPAVAAKSDAEWLEIAAQNIQEVYPAAKKVLIEKNYERQRVEAMPPAQVVAVYYRQSLIHWSDELLKWSLLPYNEIGNRYANAEEAYSGSYIGKLNLPIPPVRNALYASVRLQRRVAAVQALEALRLHASRNQGQLPESLEDVTVVPVPVDPLDRKPFRYQQEQDRAVLEVPADLEPGRPIDSWRFEFTMRGAGAND